MSRFATSFEYKEWIDSLPAEAFQPQNGADTLVTYSGRGGQNHQLAKHAVADDPNNKYCIEQTPVGAALEQDNLWETMDKKEAAAVWRHASEKTMENAQAPKMETHAVDAKHDGIFRGTELHAAFSNPNIKTINDVPCEKHMAQYDPQKIQDSVAKSELARDEKRAVDANDPATRESLQLDARTAEHEAWQQQGDKFTPERQEMQDKADATFMANRESRNVEQGPAGPQQPQTSFPPPPPPPPPPRSQEAAPSQGQGR